MHFQNLYTKSGDQDMEAIEELLSHIPHLVKEEKN